MESKSLEELVYFCKTGNYDAIIELTNRLKKYISSRLRYAYGYSLNEDDIDEITYLTMNDVLKRIDSYRSDRGITIEAYLKGIAKNRMSTHASKIRNQKRYHDHKNDNAKMISLDCKIDDDHDEAFEMIIGDPSIEYRPKERLDESVAIDEIMGLIDQCTSPLEKTVIELTIQKYSNEEMAALMNIDKRRVSNAKERAKGKLQNALKENKN